MLLFISHERHCKKKGHYAELNLRKSLTSSADPMKIGHLSWSSFGLISRTGCLPSEAIPPACSMIYAIGAHSYRRRSYVWIKNWMEINWYIKNHSYCLIRVISMWSAQKESIRNNVALYFSPLLNQVNMTYFNQ